jgi:dephospho-CoA kinase
VTCNSEQRVARFAARQKIDLETARKEVERRMAAQLSDEEKIKRADYVIDNCGSLEQTREQALQVWQELSAEASKP